MGSADVPKLVNFSLATKQKGACSAVPLLAERELVAGQRYPLGFFLVRAHLQPR